jgi:hypothetical protein
MKKELFPVPEGEQALQQWQLKWDLPVLILDERPEAAQTFRDFKWHYGGHPQFPDRIPEITRLTPSGEIANYSRRRLLSYTDEGSLVMLREDPKGKTSDPSALFVATANVVESKITEWYVSELQHEGGGSSLVTKMYLSERQLEGLEEPLMIPEDINPVEALIRAKLHAQEQQRQQELRPRLITSSQGCWFSWGGPHLESMAPMAELQTNLEWYCQKLGKISIDNRPAFVDQSGLTPTPESATIVAA